MSGASLVVLGPLASAHARLGQHAAALTAIDEALRMPPDEQRRRMHHLREEVRSLTVYGWAGHLLAEATRLAGRRR